VIEECYGDLQALQTELKAILQSADSISSNPQEQCVQSSSDIMEPVDIGAVQCTTSVFNTKFEVKFSEDLLCDEEPAFTLIYLGDIQ
jgi:hypothetical protein